MFMKLKTSFKKESSVTLYSNDEEIPKPTGKFMHVQLHLGIAYCILPSNMTDQGTLFCYQDKPSGLDLYKNVHEIGKVFIA